MGGPAPKAPEARARRNVPTLGDWVELDLIGWQHGPVTRPRGLGAAAQRAWDVWFGSWVAAHWTPDDLPGIEAVIQLYDRFMKGETSAAHNLGIWMGYYGLNHKGQQDRRWRRPQGLPTGKAEPEPKTGGHYARLRAVAG